MDNYPPGAANDPRAPYNEPLKEKVVVYVEAIYGTDIELEVMPGYTEETLREEALKCTILPTYIQGLNTDLQLVETSVFKA